MENNQASKSDIDEAEIAVVGAGAFGLALAATAVAGGHKVTIFDRSKKYFDIVKKDDALANVPCRSFDDGDVDFAKFDLVILAPSAQALRPVGQWIHKNMMAVYKSEDKIPSVSFLSAAKGIEQNTLLLPHQVLAEVLPQSAAIGALSGPSFAKELRAGLPTAVVVASPHKSLRVQSNQLLHRSFFRVYESADVVGVEVCGALKNVVAMVAGAADGLKIGNNARAAVITRGLGEIVQIGVRLGADPMTFLGLSGLGDLILTCTGDLSRNRTFGMRLAGGENVQHILQSMGETVEGVTTALSAYTLSQKYKLDTPIINVAHSVIYGGQSIHDAIYALMSRSQKGEFDWINAIPKFS